MLKAKKGNIQGLFVNILRSISSVQLTVGSELAGRVDPVAVVVQVAGVGAVALVVEEGQQADALAELWSISRNNWNYSGWNPLVWKMYGTINEIENILEKTTVGEDIQQTPNLSHLSGFAFYCK